MAFMPWTSDMSVGVERIDVQHQWLVNATNALHEEWQKAVSCRETVGRILDGLVDYTMKHFILEEELLLRFGYPETKAHKAEHDAFLVKAMQLLIAFEDGANVDREVLDFLKRWLLHHILSVDKAYVPFFRERGIV